MEQKTKSLKMLRQRKLLVVLPLLVLPFVTIMLGIGWWKNGGCKFPSSRKKGF